MERENQNGAQPNDHETIADIIAEARDKYTVNECNQCAWRKCCSEMFGSEKCGKFRESIWLEFGIDDGYFTRLLDRLEAAHKREVDKLNSVIQATVSSSDAEIDRLRRELSKTRPKNGGYFGQFDTEALRDALKDIEATVTAALAHQPEDEAKCGQFLYDALVKCFNIADLACHAARTEIGAEVSRGAATVEKSSAVGNAAKLREALKSCVDEMCDRCRELAAARGNPLPCLSGCEPVRKAKFALASPPRNCDVGTPEEQAQRFKVYCDKNKDPENENR